MKSKGDSYTGLKLLYFSHPILYNELSSSDEHKAEKYLEVLYSNPAGFELTAGITTNYRQLKTMYLQRKDHRLPEWREFCAWIRSLPNAEWLI